MLLKEAFCLRRSLGQVSFRTLNRFLLTRSYVEGPDTPALSAKTLPGFFNTEILPKHSTRPALVSLHEPPRAHGGPPSSNLGGTRNYLAWDYEEFERHIGALARGLIGMGVRKGDRVGVIIGNGSAYAMLQWACTNIGAILVTVNPAYRLTELVNVLNLSGVSHLFIVPSLRGTSHLRLLAEAFPEIRHQPQGEISTPSLPELRNLILLDNQEGEGHQVVRILRIKCVIEWREALIWAGAAREERLRKESEQGLESNEVVNLQFTSGTTGAPKAVSLTHSNLLNNALSIGSAMNFTSDDVLCNLASFTHGACVVYPSPTFEPSKVLDALLWEKCTALHGVPTHFLGILEEVEKRKRTGQSLDFGGLRTGIAAGSSVPIDLMKRLIEGMGLKDLTVAYGMTETSPVSFQSTPCDPVHKRVETVGKIRPHVKAKIVDGQGKVVDIKQPGEILVSGYLLQKGYWNNEEQTRLVMKTDDNGTVWMHTGDEGIMDEEGYLKVVGRIKDIIIRSGENLFPVEIENTLTAHPAIREAAAVAVPNETYGEVVGVWIVREDSVSRSNKELNKEEVRNVVRSALRPQNAPAWVWFVGEDGVPEELPKTASGKVMKHVLREWSSKLSERGVGRVGR